MLDVKPGSCVSVENSESLDLARDKNKQKKPYPLLDIGVTAVSCRYYNGYKKRCIGCVASFYSLFSLFVYTFQVVMSK